MNSLGEKRSHSRLLRVVIICALFVPMIVSSFVGCAHTLEEVLIFDTVIKKDTVLGNSGPRYFRFISLLSAPGSILLTKESKNIYGEALPMMVNTYIPETRTKPFTLYANYHIDTANHDDSLTIPVDSLGGPNSMYTIALFEIKDNGTSKLYPFFANDSLKRFPRFPQTNDSCYFRFMNGLPDLSPSPIVNIYITDTSSTPLFSSVVFGGVRNYVLIPAGKYAIVIRSETDQKILYQRTNMFIGGEFYTARLNGTVVGKTDVLSIDGE